MKKPRIWKTYLGARFHGARVRRAVCGDQSDDAGGNWEITYAKEHPKKGACGQEWFCLEREYDFQKWPLLCGDPHYFAKGCKWCGGFLWWKKYERPKQLTTYGRGRAGVERVYETRIDCRPVPGGARRLVVEWEALAVGAITGGNREHSERLAVDRYRWAG